jgi:nitrogen regulatory protein P-II 2
LALQGLYRDYCEGQNGGVSKLPLIGSSETDRPLAEKDARIVGAIDRFSCPGIKMKLVTAIIKPFLVDAVRDALIADGFHGMIITEVRGFGRQKGHAEVYRGAEYLIVFVPKLRIEIAVEDKRVNRLVEAIYGSARTGQVGDGKIFITPIDRVVRIRTGEVDDDAL